MRRRTFLAGMASAATSPLAARAQQPDRMPRIGVLFTGSSSDPLVQRLLQALVRGLQDLGWTADVNLRVDARYGNWDGQQIPKIAKDLVAS
jgi:putative ABC transport system substrate-binding protein